MPPEMAFSFVVCRNVALRLDCAFPSKKIHWRLGIYTSWRMSMEYVVSVWPGRASITLIGLPNAGVPHGLPYTILM